MNGRWEVAKRLVSRITEFPSGFAMERQMALGQKYFRARFGSAPEYGYNVDSFGHAAALPGLMRAAGQKYYIMMRPMDHEMTLPTRLFRWRGYEGSPEVVTFRLAGYGTRPDGVDPEHVKRTLTDLPAGILNTLLRRRVRNDHGNGAMIQTIDWVRSQMRKHSKAPNLFSSPSRFFKAIAAQTELLPLSPANFSTTPSAATRCSAGSRRACGAPNTACGRRKWPMTRGAARRQRRLKRRGSFGLLQPFSRPFWAARLFRRLVRRCTTSYGAAASVADDTLQLGLRRSVVKLPGDALQRMVFVRPVGRRSSDGFRGTRAVDEVARVAAGVAPAG